MAIQADASGRLGLNSMIVGSLAFHAVAVVGFFLFADYFNPNDKKLEILMVTKLVRLGKKRPEHLLPRLQQPAPPPATPAPTAPPPKVETPAPKVKPDVKPVPKPNAKKKPRPSAKKASSKANSKKLHKKMSSALDRLRAASAASNEEPEGDPDGSVDGEVSDAAFAVMGSVYATKLKAAIMNCYTIEGLSPSQVRGKTATLWARVNHSGVIVDFRIEKTSGIELLDRSLMKAVQNCSRGPNPPRELRKRLYHDGIAFNFTP